MKTVNSWYFITFLIFIVVHSTSYAQKSGPNPSKLEKKDHFPISQHTTRDSLIDWQERVVLHIANEHVADHDLLFFKAYLLTGIEQNRNSFSRVLNVELLDSNNVLIKKQFHEVVEGSVHGQMKIPKNIAPGKYHLRAYTRWMQNYAEEFFAQKDILVGSSLRDMDKREMLTDILITPEGGTLLNNYHNRLIIRIPKVHASRVIQNGRILDNRKKEVASINFHNTGMGATIFKPDQKKHYILELENGESFAIPKAKDHGFLLHVNNLDPDKALIRVTASSEVMDMKITLVGTSGGIRHFENKLEFKNNNVSDVELPKRNIPSGIFILKLINENGTELARRPIWIDSEQLSINVTPVVSNTDETTYKIKVTDNSGSAMQAQLALSIKSIDQETARNLDNTVIYPSNLLEFSEMMEDGNVSTNRKHRFLKDLTVILSDKKIENPSSKLDEFTSDLKFPIQKGLELSGYAYDLDNTLLTNTKIQVLAQTDKEVWIKEVQTDANGLLVLERIQISGKAKFIFRTIDKNMKNRKVKLRPLEEEELEEIRRFTDFPTKNKERVQRESTTSGSVDSISLKQRSHKPLAAVDSKRLIELEEVEVITDRDKRHRSTPSIYGISVPEVRIKYQDLNQPKSIGRLLLGIPGVFVSGDLEFNPSVTIPRANGPVLYVLDGFPLAQGGGLNLGSSSNNSLAEVMTMVSAVDIERIELLIGPDAAIFGSRASGGVIAIYTRNGSELRPNSRNQGELDFIGYEPEIEFGTYYNGLSKRKQEQANLIYWNPKIETDENGETIIRIQIPILDSQIKIEASTITNDGKIGSLRKHL